MLKQSSFHLQWWIKALDDEAEEFQSSGLDKECNEPKECDDCEYVCVCLYVNK